MLNSVEIEEAYKRFMGDLPKCAHDGIIHVDLRFLQESGLLATLQDDQVDREDLTQYFHVIESAEKVTLFNDQFVVWIVPRMEQDMPMTYILLALNNHSKLNLEIVFTTCGVYNTPRYVLKILQHFLLEVLETEATITSMEKCE
ncbi:MAG: hypothetical protein HW387_1395 [Parachlamydiales bacterium]|nr:hypothetical protein [Parachlamydiales bacterium]